MTVRLLTATLGLAALALTAAPAATAGGGTHTETFVSRVQSHVALGHDTGAIEFAQDTSRGQVIGADTTTAHFHQATGIVTGQVTFVRRNGMLTGTFTLDTNTGAVSGTIDAGVGSYHGATGSFTGQAVNRKVTDVTLTWTS